MNSIARMAALATVAVLTSLAFPGSAPGQEVAYQAGPLKVLGPDSDRLIAGLGAYNFSRASEDTPRQRDIPPMAEIEYRFGWKPDFLGRAIGPTAGILANADGGVFGYFGVYADLAVGDFVVTPLAAAGGYHEGGSKDLGGTFQFRIGITGAYQLADGTRLGLRVAHISNAGINDRNPGENDVLFVLDVPLW